MTKKALFNILVLGVLFAMLCIGASAMWVFDVVYMEREVDGEIIFYLLGLAASVGSVLTSTSYLAFIEKLEDKEIEGEVAE